MRKNVFIARQKELKQLSEWLSQAVDGHGRVCFVTGEAGSGKTTLVSEFTRRAQEQYKDLVVAVGQSDAQTGIGDAHLPFREIMAQLTGDVEAKLTQGAITDENANRLRKLLVLSGQALVDVGPDLIGIFVPGIGLATRVGTFVAEKAGWLDKLENLARKPKEKSGSTGLLESHIFEQYSNVICHLSQKNPLLLVLDDMHWADAASIALLFHLGRRISEHKILIISTYRPAEVAIGRAGDRHPLEKVLTEFKRYYGDISLDLDQAIKDEGRLFVDAFLDSEKNALGTNFGTKLFQQTGGHPLFTIELLRNMQERGDLVCDEQDRWVESSSLNWKTLPKRVEGVIEERIGRLQQELRQMLTVGCIQGEDFTAEVVARVQKAEAGGLIRRLSGELERQHRLVSAEGTRRLDPGGQRLSLYRFQHNLFRAFLYNELGEAERTYLHEDVGNALEDLYGDQADEILIQLALHFEIAGVVEKARFYLQKAAEQAVARYANEEAIDYFSRALKLIPESETGQIYGLLLAREKVYALRGERDFQERDLERLGELALTLGNDLKKAEVAIRQVTFSLATSDFPAAITAAQETIQLAGINPDPNIAAQAHFSWGDASQRMGDYDLARDHFNQALTISKAAGLPQLESTCLRGMGVIASQQGDFVNAQKFFEDSLKISQREGDRIGSSKTLNNLGRLFCNLSEYEKARDCLQEALIVFHEIGDRRSETVVLGNLGAAAADQGDLQAALSYFEQSRSTSHEVGDRESESIMLGNLGNLSAQMGDLKASRQYLEKALTINREIGNKYHEVITLHSMGMNCKEQGEYSKAIVFYDEAIELAIEYKIKNFEGSTFVQYGSVYDSLGDFKNAKKNYNSAIEIYREIEEGVDESKVFYQLGLLFHHMGQDEKSRQICLEVIDKSNKIGDQESEACAYMQLGNALVELGKIDDAEEAYDQSIAIRQKMGQGFKATEPQAGLARIALLHNRPGKALFHIEQILEFLQDHSLDGTDEPMRIYLTCYQVLKANKDIRASEILRTAHNLLLERVSLLEDETLRKSYLENVTANREIQEAFSSLA
ncbi:MAG: tetratricopeptide repeat protein [Chloroflexota bacterium]